MNDYWQNFKKKFQEGVQTVSEKTEELTRIGRLKLQIIAVKRDIEKSFTELGGRTYEILISANKKEIEKNPDIGSIVDEIREQEMKLQQLETDVKEIQNLRREKQSDDDE
jgi:hypothetical protein